MLSNLRILLIATLISLIGSLPLGALNITAFQFTLAGSLKAALLFSVGAVLVEVLYVRIALFKLFDLRKWFDYLLPLLVVFLAILGTYTIVHSNDGMITQSGPLLAFPFFAGVAMSALNPLQIPFWVLWNNFLVEKEYLSEDGKQYFHYLLGITIGSALSFALFILAAIYYRSDLLQHIHFIRIVVGALYIVGALYFTLKFFQIQLKKSVSTL